MDVATAGKTIVVRGGTYEENIHIAKSGLKIRSYPNELAVIHSDINDSTKESTIKFETAGSGCLLFNIKVLGGYAYAIKFDDTWDTGTRTGTGSSNNTVQNCVVGESGTDCIKITPAADGITIMDCEIYSSGLRDPSNAEGVDNVNGDNMTLQDCNIHNIATTGVYVKGGGKNCLIQRNLIQTCGAIGIALGKSTDLVWHDASNTQGWENIDGIARNNVVIAIQGGGLHMQGALRPKFYNNTCINVAISLYAGIEFDSPQGGSSARTTNPTLRNNIIMLSSGRQMIEIRALGYAFGATMSNNRYYNSTGAASFRDVSANFIGNLAAWKSHIATDTNSTEGNPQLNATNGILNAGSPCINTGVDLSSSFTDDFSKNTRPAGAWDIGAREK